MTDNPTIEEKKPEEVIREVKFIHPDVITFGHWTIYNTARLEYQATTLYPDGLIAEWKGAAALVKKGIVKIEGFDELVNALRNDKPEDVDGNLLSIASEYITLPVRIAINRPLEGYLRGSSDTGKIKINGLLL